MVDYGKSKLLSERSMYLYAKYFSEATFYMLKWCGHALRMGHNRLPNRSDLVAGRKKKERNTRNKVGRRSGRSRTI
jgi:hypothetical protein